MTHLLTVAVVGALAVWAGAGSAVAEEFSGEVRLVLKDAVFAAPFGQEQPRLHDVELSLRCRQGKWERRAWGHVGTLSWAHNPGTVEVEAAGEQLRLKVAMPIHSDLRTTGGEAVAQVDWHYSPPGDDYWKSLGEASWEIELRRDGQKLEGTYTGKFSNTPVKGAALGQLTEPFARDVAGHTAPNANEHPRLLFRKGDIETIRKTIQSPQGQTVFKQFRELIGRDKGGFSYGGTRSGTAGFPYTEGYHAAGHAFVYLFTGEKAELQRAKELTEIALKPSGEMGGWGMAQRMTGVALAYDLCGQDWDEPFRKRVQEHLVRHSLGRAGPPDSHYHMMFHASSALCALAVKGDVDAPDLDRNIEHAEEAIRLWMKTGLGNTGMGGDFTGIGEAVRELLPFVKAYRNAAGKDILSGTGLEWIVPLKILAGDRPNRFLSVGQAFFTVRPELRGVAKWYIDKNGLDVNDGSCAYLGIYPLIDPPFDIKAEEPQGRLPLSLLDGRMGTFYARSGWEDDATVLIADARQSCVTTPVSASDLYVRGMGQNWIASHPGDYGVFWLPRPDKSEAPSVLSVPGLLPLRGAKVTAYDHGKPESTSLVTMQRDAFAIGKPWAWKTTYCLQHRIEDPKDAGVTAQRTVAVDYSGDCGAPALIVVVDTIKGHGDRRPVWRAHLNKNVQIQAEGDAFVDFRKWFKLEKRPIEDELTRLLTPEGKRGEEPTPPSIRALPQTQRLLVRASGDAKLPPAEQRSMQMLFVAPRAVNLSNQDRSILATAPAGGDEQAFVVVLTLQKGAAPAAKVETDGATTKVRIGKRLVLIEGQAVRFGQ